MTGGSGSAPPAGPIRVGVGGWDYEPWRGSFFPAGLAKAGQLGHSSRVLTAIEVNGTFYRTQTPDTFRRWAAETPEGFVFTLKAPRYVVSRRILAEAGDGIARFLESGITELGPKLGPILWQLAPTRAFDQADLAAFLSLLPRRFDGRELQHALEVRHASFLDGRFVALARQFEVPVVYADSDVYPAIADLTGAFVYARLQRCIEAEETGYSAEALDLWAERARIWVEGGAPAGLNYVSGEPAPTLPAVRPVYLFFISGAKIRAPAAAQALLQRLAHKPATRRNRGLSPSLMGPATENDMTKDFKPGDKVSWKSSGGEAVGHVVKKVTGEMHIKGHKVAASKDNPEYLVESAKSGGRAAHKPEALKKL